MLLSGYGSYGISQNATFSSNRLSLLDRGVVFAIAHIRGGGEMGKTWHDAGPDDEARRTRSPTSSPAPSTWSAREVHRAATGS